MEFLRQPLRCHSKGTTRKSISCRKLSSEFGPVTHPVLRASNLTKELACIDGLSLISKCRDKCLARQLYSHQSLQCSAGLGWRGCRAPHYRAWGETRTV